MREYLHHFRLGENVYYLNKAGREWIGSEKEVKKTLQVEHYLMRNEVYILYGCPKSWEMEKELRGKVQKQEDGRFKLVPFKMVADAYFKKDDVNFFVEIDNTQKMQENKKKVEKYDSMIPTLKKQNQLAQVIWLTTTETRKKKLEKLTDDNHIIYTIQDLL